MRPSILILQRVVWSGLEFSPDDRFIAINTADRGVLIVDSFYPTRELALLQDHAYDPAHASNISFSPDGSVLAVGECSFMRSYSCIVSLMYFLTMIQCHVTLLP